MRTWLFCLLALLATCTLYADPKKFVRGYTLGTVKYSEIKDMLNKVKSEDGHISYVKMSNKVLVNDIAAVHKVVQQILLQGAGEIVNIRVDITFLNPQFLSKKGIKIGYTYKDGSTDRLKLTRRNGKTNKIKSVDLVDLHDQNTVKSQNAQISVTAASGEAGQLWATRNVLDGRHLRRYNLVPYRDEFRPGNPPVIIDMDREPPVERLLGTSLWVRPTYLKTGLVRIEVFPVISYETKEGGEQLFRVDKVKTTVTVRPGARMYIGGGTKSMGSFMRDLFGTELGNQRASSATSFYVTPHVKILNPSKRHRSTPQPNKRRSDSGSYIWRHF